MIGDPGPVLLFDAAVYYRGAVTLQALRNEVGDRDFFRILLFPGGKPVLAGAAAATAPTAGAPPAAASMLERLSRQGARLRR